MNFRQSLRLLRSAAFLLFATTLPAYAAALYETSITGDLTINAQGGGIDYAQLVTQPASVDALVNPPGQGTAVASADFTEFTPTAANTIRVKSTANGTALPSQEPGTLSFATGTVGGGLLVTNPGTSAVQLFITIDIDWAWKLLVDNPANETASAVLSLDFYADGRFLETLTNLFVQGVTGSDSLLTTVLFDPNDPLATLDPGASRLFSIVASATGNATSVPEPGTVSLLLFAGLIGIIRTSGRHA